MSPTPDGTPAKVPRSLKSLLDQMSVAPEASPAPVFFAATYDAALVLTILLEGGVKATLAGPLAPGGWRARVPVLIVYGYMQQGRLPGGPPGGGGWGASLLLGVQGGEGLLGLGSQRELHCWSEVQVRSRGRPFVQDDWYAPPPPSP